MAGRRVSPQDAWGHVVQPLGVALSDESGGLAAVHTALRRALETGAWRHYFDPYGNAQEPTSFAEFLTTKPFGGVGAASVKQVRDLIADDDRLRDRFDQELQGRTGRPRRTNPKSVDNVNTIRRPDGNAKDAALRRLRKDRPDLHRRVLHGDLSPHAAMIEAGFRHRTATVPVDDVHALAIVLLRRLAPDDLDVLIKLLQEIPDG